MRPGVACYTKWVGIDYLVGGRAHVWGVVGLVSSRRHMHAAHARKLACVAQG